MKNNLHTTEELLQKGKEITLSVSERTDMKATLLSYARYHGVREKATKKLVMSNFFTRSFASVSLVLVFLVGGVGYASTSSLPGEFLYPVKTNVVEELIAVTKRTPFSQLEYHHERYEMRLLELQTLSKNGDISPIALQDSRTELSELSKEVGALMDGQDHIEDAVALEFVGDMIAMSTATEEILRSAGERDQLEVFESITDQLEQMHRDEVVDLLKNSTTTIEIFIQEQLLEIGDKLAENDLEAVITTRITDYVEDAQISLQAEDYKDVVQLVSNAIILIDTEEYSNDYEDEISE